MREARSAVIAHHVRLALQNSALTMRVFATAVRDLYDERTPLHARAVQFHRGGDIYADERANAQIVDRMVDGAVRLPADVEEAAVLSLPQPFRGACLRELAARYGLLAAPQVPTDQQDECVRAADLLRECAEAVQALPAVLSLDADGPINSVVLDRADAELIDVQAVVACLRASIQARREARIVDIRRAG